MDGNEQQNRPGADLLDPKIHPDEKRQAIPPARAYVAKDACSHRKSGQNRMANFTEGYISSHFYSIQHFHLLLSGNYLNGADWTRQFINKILQLTNLQWIYRNISLHNKRQGYLRNKQLEDLLWEILDLSDLSPEDVPESCRFLLDINFTDLASTCLETKWC
jgi:hypothetical protein